MTSKPTYEELEQRLQLLENANKKLTETSERYHSFIDSFHGIAFRGEIKTFKPVYFHGAVEEITGYQENDFVNGDLSWDKLVHPDDLPMLLEQGKSMMKIPGYTFRREYRIFRKDGQIIWVFERGRALNNEQGQPTWLEGTLFDITHRKNIEQELRSSEERYRTLVETASLGIQISDCDGKIILSNSAHHEILGLEDGQIIGKYIWDFVDDKEEKKKLKEYYKVIINEQPEPEPYFTVNKRPDGSEFNVRVDWNYLRDSNGEVTSLVSIITDISSWIWAENVLKESERKFRRVIESSPEGMHMYRLDPDGRLIFIGANPAADKILGIDHQLLIGKTLEEAFPTITKTEVPEKYREICRTGKSWQADQITYEDERIRGIYEVHAFQTDANKMVAFFTDVTKKRFMEEELQKVQKLESVGILAGGIAHDFNNLLTAILGNISMAKIFSQTDPAKVQERLIDAENASLRARDLTQQLLTFSKGGAPVKAAASITDIVRDSSSFMLSGSNVKCNQDFQQDLWPVNIDEGQISQVIQNMIKNADQAMPEGGTVSVRATNETISKQKGLPLQPGNYVHLVIADEGIGIPERHITKIFDPYFTTKQEGSGLGLAACYSIIKNHDGHVLVESEYGAGTTFHIYLPASESMPEPPAKPRDSQLHSGEKILIMDDDKDVLNVAANMLNLMGYKPDTAFDGNQAIEKYRQAMQSGQAFDGVILDLTIPGGMGGQETLRQLQMIDPGVKAIVSSGYANDPIMAEYGKYGFKGVATKPYDMEHLGQVLRSLFD